MPQRQTTTLRAVYRRQCCLFVTMTKENMVARIISKIWRFRMRVPAKRQIKTVLVLRRLMPMARRLRAQRRTKKTDLLLWQMLNLMKILR